MSILKFFRKTRDLGITGHFTKWYDKNTRENRLSEMIEYAEIVKKHINEGAHVLEVAPGPGYLSISLAKLGNYHITGMDISHDFVKICKDNAKRESVNVNFIQGNVTAMYFDSDSFDFIVCSAAFKNFKEPEKALNEICRVLKKGGIALIIDMRKDVKKEELKAEAVRVSNSGFERLFMINTFKMLCNSAYTTDQMKELVSKTEFSSYNLDLSSIGFNLYLYK